MWRGGSSGPKRVADVHASVTFPNDLAPTIHAAWSQIASLASAAAVWHGLAAHKHQQLEARTSMQHCQGLVNCEMSP